MKSLNNIILKLTETHTFYGSVQSCGEVSKAAFSVGENLPISFNVISSVYMAFLTSPQ